MKIGILSDCHSNHIALKSVIEDGKSHNVEKWIFVGDLIGFGPCPDICFELIKELDPIAWVVGNHDNLFHKMHEEYKEETFFIKDVIMSNYNLKYLASDAVTFLENLPIIETIEIDGINISIFHATPKSPHGHLTHPLANQHIFDDQLKEVECDIAIYGHEHVQLNRWTSDFKRILNPGAIGLPSFDELKTYKSVAQYIILNIEDEMTREISFRTIPYDVTEVIKIAEKRKVPYLELYAEFLLTGNYMFSKQSLDEINKKKDYAEIANKICIV